MADDLQALGAAIAAASDLDAPERRHGKTALHYAAGSFTLDAARELISAGACVDARDDHGNTPLFGATFDSRGRGEMIQLLREAGADPDVENLHGVSPRMLAHTIGNYDVRQFYAS